MASGLFVGKLDFCVNAYESYFPDANKGRIILNYRMLSEALGHYFCDMDRLTSFRGMSYCDEHKKAAYLMKWICKIKPIQMVVAQSQHKQDPCYSPGQANANEVYAVWLGIGELSIPFSKIPRHYTRNLLYLLRHHAADADFLASELFLLDTCFAPRYKHGHTAPCSGYYAELDIQEVKVNFWGWGKAIRLQQLMHRNQMCSNYFRESRDASTDVFLKSLQHLD